MVEIKGDEASRENGLSGEKSLSKENTVSRRNEKGEGKRGEAKREKHDSE